MQVGHRDTVSKYWLYFVLFSILLVTQWLSVTTPPHSSFRDKIFSDQTVNPECAWPLGFSGGQHTPKQQQQHVSKINSSEQPEVASWLDQHYSRLIYQKYQNLWEKEVFQLSFWYKPYQPFPSCSFLQSKSTKVSHLNLMQVLWVRTYIRIKFELSIILHPAAINFVKSQTNKKLLLLRWIY